MNPKKSIRVIKSAQREAKVTEAPAQSGKKSRRGDGEVADRVGAWVKEFQQRRRADARRAFASLFVAPDPALNS